MIERIIAGVVIGLVAGFALGKNFDEGSNARSIVLVFIALVMIAFIGSSFMFGAIYGAMAVGEIALGYWVSNKIFGKEKST